MSEFDGIGKDEGGGTATVEAPATKNRSKVKKKFARKWKIIILDNPVTTMDFVVQVLFKTFKYDAQKCFKIMAETHTNGFAICFLGSKEVCELKLDIARILIKTAAYEGDKELALNMEADE